MKKLLTILSVLIIITSNAQNDSTKSSVTGYVSGSISMSNSTDFKKTSYTSIEGGIMKDNFGLGLMFGRGSLYGLGSKIGRAHV